MTSRRLFEVVRAPRFISTISHFFRREVGLTVRAYGVARDEREKDENATVKRLRDSLARSLINSRDPRAVYLYEGQFADSPSPLCLLFP